MARLKDFLRQFVLEPFAKKSPALFLLRVTQIAHDRTGGMCDAPLRKVMSRLRPPAALPTSGLMSDDEIASTVATVQKNGWSILPWALPPNDLEELRRFAFSTPAYAETFASRRMVDETSSTREHPRYEWLIGDILKVPAVGRLLSDSALHEIAQRYLGCRPVLTSITMWLDGVCDRPFDAHVYHYDNDGPGFLKFFIYLSDVDSDTGAHTYIQRSHGRRKPHRFRRSKRYERNDLLDCYGTDNEIVFAAPAGTIIAEDTAGFHRGIDPRRGYRLLAQLEYSVIDIPHAEEFAVGIPKLSIDVHPGIARIARKFIAQSIR